MPKLFYKQKTARQLFAKLDSATRSHQSTTEAVRIREFTAQFIISRTRAFIFTSPSSDKLRNFSATLALTARSADSRIRSLAQRCCAVSTHRLASYFSRHDNKRICRFNTLCLSLTPAASVSHKHRPHQTS